MPTFEIEQYELHAMKYTVEAADEAQAIAKLLKGLTMPLDNGLAYVEVVDDRGLPADEHPALAAALRNMGISVNGVIPSIRCIEEVEGDRLLANEARGRLRADGFTDAEIDAWVRAYYTQSVGGRDEGDVDGLIRFIRAEETSGGRSAGSAD